MTSHRDHDHPATPAARAACRKLGHLAGTVFAPMDPITARVARREAELDDAFDTETDLPLGYSEYVPVGLVVTITDEHCQQCGSTLWENIETDDDPDFQGYTRCCNERVVGGWGATCDPTECSH